MTENILEVNNNNFICEYCNKSYKTLSNLNNHKKTAKFCLNLQKESNPDKEVKILKCEYCDKEFTNKFILNKHLDICSSKSIYNKLMKEKEEKDKQIKELIKYIEELNEQIKEKDKNYNLLSKTMAFKDLIIKEKDMIIKEKNLFIQTNLNELMNRIVNDQ
jgi:hypothetical protein